ncbi:hypothetical protein BJY52DRAFT_1186221 [Lactarius psammicola]|nr:hypothetical protein BJY52DRAFT_1186221 [Lactarius psammicola]
MAFMLPSVSFHSGDGPLQTAFRVQPEGPTPGSDRGWNFPPNPNSTHHLIFNSVSGLLQRWPNALRRNGHSLVPVTIPKGTILYHGRTDPQIPNSPDWLAFDFEFAYIFCLESCYVISLQAKRDLRLVYFDGLSAAYMKDGTLDSQDVILWGRPRPDKFISDMERIESLCDWGRPLGLDGFVRMGFHFEVMMTKGSPYPGLPRANRGHSPYQVRPGLPSGWRGSPPTMRRTILEGFLAGTWHDRAPGETRMRPDYSSLVTFYDPSLSSLVEARYGKDRSHLRLEGISALDSERVRTELQTVLTREQDGGSGVDWGSIVRVVTERYADRLEYLRFLLSPNTTTFADALERAAVARAQLARHAYAIYHNSKRPRAAARIGQLKLGSTGRAAESRIHAAVENTLHEICRRLVLVWVEFFDVEAADLARATEATEVARGHIEELIVWLDWSVWVRCEPGCSLGEFCYFPSWPYFQGDNPYDLTPRCRSFEGFAR